VVGIAAAIPRGGRLHDQQPMPVQMAILMGSRLFSFSLQLFPEVSVNPYP
jgi:hypothetical protein